MSFDGHIETAQSPNALAEVSRLAHVIWREHYPPIIGHEQVEYMLDRGYTPAALATEQAAGSHFLLACNDNNAAVGYAGWTADADEQAVAWLDKLYVLDAARGTGVATALLRRVVADSGNATLKLRVNRDNTASIAAYRRLGFDFETTDVKAIGNGFVMDDYIMRRPPETLTSA